MKAKELKIGDHFKSKTYGYGHRVPFHEVPINRKFDYNEGDFIWVWLDTYSYDGRKEGDYLGLSTITEVEPVNVIEPKENRDCCNCSAPEFISTGFTSTWIVCKKCKKEKR